PEAVLAQGHKDGHFGMLGMRERAERIGGTIMVSSTPSGGTEVTLVLPARLAFAKRGLRRSIWLPRFLRRSTHHGWPDDPCSPCRRPSLVAGRRRRDRRQPVRHGGGR